MTTRGARHRQHRDGAGISDRRGPHADQYGPRRHEGALPAYQAGRTSLHRLAQPNLEAGRCRRERRLCGRWIAFRCRRRRGVGIFDATFVDPHVSIGQVTAYEAIGLIRKMPVEAVMRMALVGRHERIDAKRAYELGMISQIVDPPERLREEAQVLAEKIAKNSPAAMAATKRALWGALEIGSHRRLPGRGQGTGGHVGPSRPGGRTPAFAEKRAAVGRPRTRK